MERIYSDRRDRVASRGLKGLGHLSHDTYELLQDFAWLVEERFGLLVTPKFFQEAEVAVRSCNAVPGICSPRRLRRPRGSVVKYVRIRPRAEPSQAKVSVAERPQLRLIRGGASREEA